MASFLRGFRSGVLKESCWSSSLSDDNCLDRVFLHEERRGQVKHCLENERSVFTESGLCFLSVKFSGRAQTISLHLLCFPIKGGIV